METLPPPRGLIVELITPFKEGGGIDSGGLARLLARTAPFVQGVFLASPRAGEGLGLSAGLRQDLLLETMKALRHAPLPILIWATQESEDATRETIEALNAAVDNHEYGADLFWVDTPLYYHSNRRLPDLYREIGHMGSAPLILHNDPELIKPLSRPLKRTNIRTAILKELVEFSRISGLIFSGSLDRAHNYQRACRGQAAFRIYDGDEVQFLDFPSKSGVVSMGANLAPRAWQRITQSSLHLSAHKKDYPDHLQQIWETGDDLRRLRTFYAEAPAAIIRDMLADMGVIEAPAAPPPLQTEAPRNRFREIMSRLSE